LTACAGRATSFAHEHDQIDLRLLRLRSRQQSSIHGGGEEARPNRILAENGIRLVYGGGSVGLMGALAESVLDHGGAVTGVIPDFLVNREHMLVSVQERLITRDMHERKRLMFERADAFVALPGGVGTLEELVEQLTWAQLGRHKKPILALNVARFWDPLCTLLEQMEKLDFIRAHLPVMLLVAERVEDILPKLLAAARSVAEADKEMARIPAERM
jgi:uncharacterized protein (TIGR00730 family)